MGERYHAAARGNRRGRKTNLNLNLASLATARKNEPRKGTKRNYIPSPTEPETSTSSSDHVFERYRTGEKKILRRKSPDETGEISIGEEPIDILATMDTSHLKDATSSCSACKSRKDQGNNVTEHHNPEEQADTDQCTERHTQDPHISSSSDGNNSSFNDNYEMRKLAKDKQVKISKLKLSSSLTINNLEKEISDLRSNLDKALSEVDVKVAKLNNEIAKLNNEKACMKNEKDVQINKLNKEVRDLKATTKHKVNMIINEP